MDFLIEISLNIICKSRQEAEILEISIKIDAEETGWSRLDTKVRSEDNLCTLEIRASDPVALRAALNSYLRWAHTILELLEILNNSPENTISA